MLESIGTPGLNLSFTLLVAVLLAVDFLILKHEGEHRVSTREAPCGRWSYGLAAILVFIGIKMLLLDIYKIPTGIALGVVGLIPATSVVASLMTSKPPP
jgi:hypothetical protein